MGKYRVPPTYARLTIGEKPYKAGDEVELDDATAQHFGLIPVDPAAKAARPIRNPLKGGRSATKGPAPVVTVQPATSPAPAATEAPPQPAESPQDASTAPRTAEDTPEAPPAADGGRSARRRR